MCFWLSRRIETLERKMQEFDELKTVIGSAVAVIQQLVAKITNTPQPVPDPTPADVTAATAGLRDAVTAAQSVLNPPATA